MPSVLSVKQLNLYVRSLIEGDSRLSYVSVSGEISNFKNHYSSGHLYFSLKDNDALIKCIMFKSNAARLKAALCDGMAVICRGRVSLYEKDGQYQFYVESIVPAGDGELAEKFRLIKEKLEKEGIFDAVFKKPIPKFPKTVAVVTSDSGAALQDILNIITRRFPLCNVILCPVLVQGSDAPADIIDSLNRLYKLKKADVIIVGRGGGSAEDLWAFNDEALARTIFASPIPVISAVGHETDFTICDFAADLRAPTPSAAAELAVPDISELSVHLVNIKRRLINSLSSYLNSAQSRLNKAMQSVYLINPNRIFEDRILRVDSALLKLKNALITQINAAENNFNVAVAKLESISPLKVLSRGYAVVSDGNKAIKTVNSLESGQNIKVSFKDGSAQCNVIKIYKE